ncbi:hypothetical protein D8674_038918 [Pyrus ussuriensis x Pyrus communis]|uniref:Peptidase C1A papain C-terminal domain-containing protein n=1 Tax=Pyrus ussuriensis x Pyrus communis TaxID=2448454 RepID=A0A5N5I368_9ROSA|nr:hypothetical protein D8674_038918 [Pyrus ussuriensis x Pyrus communis]
MGGGGSVEVEENVAGFVVKEEEVGEETSIIRNLIFCFAKRFLPLLCKEAVFTAETRDLLVTKRLFSIMSIFGRGTFKFRGMEASLVTNGHKKMISTPWISNLLGLGSPSSIHSLKRGQTYGQCFGLDQRGHPSPYSMDHPKNMAPALFAVEEYNKKKNAKLHFVRVVYARQMLYHGDFIQNVYFDAIDGGVTEMYNARVQSRFGCNMKLISFDGGFSSRIRGLVSSNLFLTIIESKTSHLEMKNSNTLSQALTLRHLSHWWCRPMITTPFPAGQSYRISILGRPSPYSMNHLLLGRPSPYPMDHPMAPARFSVEEYNKKKTDCVDTKMDFSRAVTDYIVDWRPIMGPIRDQMDSSRCWAISTCVCAEVLYALKTRRRVMLSPQSIVHRLRVSSDRGYSLSKSFELMNTGGAVLEKDWSYMGKRKKGESEMERMLDKYPIAFAIASNPGMIVGPQEVPEQICTSSECPRFRHVVRVHCSYCGVGCGLHALVLVGHGVTDEGQRFWMLRDSYGREGREDGNILIEKGKDVLGIGSFSPTMAETEEPTIPFKNLSSREYQGHKKKVHSVAWNCTGTKLASGSVDQTARVRHIEPHGHGKAKDIELKGHTDGVDQLCWDPKHADLIATASGDKTVRLWDARSNV